MYQTGAFVIFVIFVLIFHKYHTQRIAEWAALKHKIMNACKDLSFASNGKIQKIIMTASNVVYVSASNELAEVLSVADKIPEKNPVIVYLRSEDYANNKILACKHIHEDTLSIAYISL